LPVSDINIILTGFMGTGKSSVARELARLLGRKIIDVDAEIEKKGMPITEIFKTHGEPYFRDMESTLLKELSGARQVIISTGGGIVLRAENRGLLKKIGIVICLTASPETILARTSKTTERPLLQVPDPLGTINDLLAARDACYRDADLMIATDGKNPREVAEEILEKLEILPERPSSNNEEKNSIRVELAERSYEIHMGKGTLPQIGEALLRLKLGKRIAIVSNPTVFPLYGPLVFDSLKSAGFEPYTITIPDGEEYKNLDSANLIYTELLKEKFERGSSLLALGGGVIGDITGFAASTYMRGIRFIQVPTTLLAQVDSSVGGKTGVNHPLGKNMIGAFWQPSLVWIDIETLKTLPKKEFIAGMAEVIKYGVIKDEELFSFLEAERDAVLSQEPEKIIHLIRKSCEIKAEVVSLDEREAGLRAILNYGHTIGHAIETLTHYTKYLHGEAVAIGMHVEAKLAQKKNLLQGKETERIRNLISSYGLPTDMPQDFTLEEVFTAMQVDKKVAEGRVRVVLPEKIGSVRVEKVERKDFEGLF
jgi:shikimate kinase/3-dehydroquinate synthase